MQLNEDFPAVSGEAVRAKGMRLLEHLPRSLPCLAKHRPTDASLEEGIYKSDLDQVEEAQGEAVVNRFQLPVPKRR